MSGLFAGYRRLGETETAAPANLQAGLPARSDEPVRPPDWPVSPGTRVVLSAAGTGWAQAVEVRTRLWQAERARARQALEAVMELASQYLTTRYNAVLREHGDVLDWPAAVVRDFVQTELIPSIEARLEGTDGDLAEQHQRLQADFDALQTEHNRLRVAFELDERELAMMRRQRPAVETDEADASEAQAPADEADTTAHPETEGGDEAADRDRTDDLMRLIAATGLARLARIREKLAAAWRLERRGAALRIAINRAVKAQYVKLFDTQTDWQGTVRSVFVELTPAGIAYVRSLGIEPAESEIKEGLRLGFDLAQLNLILRAMDMLQAEGYTAVRPFPQQVVLRDGHEHHPVLAVVDTSGNHHYVECERESSQMKGDAYWRWAALANGGAVWLITTTPAMQNQLVSEINLVRAGQSFGFLVCNVADYLRKERGKDGSMWTERD